MEWGGLPLGRLADPAEQLRCGGLVEADPVGHPQEPDRLEQAERAQGVDVGGVLGFLEAHRDVRLRAEVVDLVGLDIAHDAGEVGGVGEVAVVQEQPAIVGRAGPGRGGRCAAC